MRPHQYHLDGLRWTGMKQNSEREKNSVRFKTFVDQSSRNLGDNLGDPSYFSMHLSDCLCHISFRCSPLSLELLGRLGFKTCLSKTKTKTKTCLSKTKTKTKTTQFQDQDQDQDSAVSRPRPRLAYPRPRPRPRLKTYKTNTGSP